MIEPEDPPAYSIINESGKRKVLLVGDHVSNIIPQVLNNLGLDETTLNQHIAYDIGTRNSRGFPTLARWPFVGQGSAYSCPFNEKTSRS